MPSRTGIRWKPGEKEKLLRELKAFNDKRRRAIKKDPSLINTIQTYPPKKTVSQIKSRSELKNLQAELALSRKKDAFSYVKVGNIKVTKWERDVQRRKLRRLNQKRAAKRRKANVSTEKGTMGTIRQANLQPKKPPKPHSRTEWEKFVKTVEKQLSPGYENEKNTLYRTNYYQAFLENYGLQRATEIMQLLEKLSSDEIVDAMHWNPILNIEFQYNESEQDIDERAQDIIDTWKEYIESIGKGE